MFWSVVHCSSRVEFMVLKLMIEGSMIGKTLFRLKVNGLRIEINRNL